MIQAVIFDIDGTIIDSVDLHIEAWKRTFESFGKDVSDEQIRRQIGKGADDMLPLFFSTEELNRFRSTAKGEEINIYKEIARIADLVDCVACSERGFNNPNLIATFAPWHSISWVTYLRIAWSLSGILLTISRLRAN